MRIAAIIANLFLSFVVGGIAPIEHDINEIDNIERGYYSYGYSDSMTMEK